MADSLFAPSRADVWFADFDHEKVDVDGNPVIGDDGKTRYLRFREHGGRRPCVVLSTNAFNRGGSGLVIVVPMTTIAKNARTHVVVDPPEGGLRDRSFVIRHQRGDPVDRAAIPGEETRPSRRQDDA